MFIAESIMQLNQKAHQIYLFVSISVPGEMAFVNTNLPKSFSMFRFMLIGFLVAILLSIPIDSVRAEIITPATNLSGLKSLKERINVELSLKGADEFDIEVSEIVNRVRTTLGLIGLSFEKGDASTPSLVVDINGESVGHGALDLKLSYLFAYLFHPHLLRTEVQT